MLRSPVQGRPAKGWAAVPQQLPACSLCAPNSEFVAIVLWQAVEWLGPFAERCRQSAGAATAAAAGWRRCKLRSSYSIVFRHSYLIPDRPHNQWWPLLLRRVCPAQRRPWQQPPACSRCRRDSKSDGAPEQRPPQPRLLRRRSAARAAAGGIGRPTPRRRPLCLQQRPMLANSSSSDSQASICGKRVGCTSCCRRRWMLCTLQTCVSPHPPPS